MLACAFLRNSPPKDPHEDKAGVNVSPIAQELEEMYTAAHLSQCACSQNELLHDSYSTVSVTRELQVLHSLLPSACLHVCIYICLINIYKYVTGILYLHYICHLIVSLWVGWMVGRCWAKEDIIESSSVDSASLLKMHLSMYLYIMNVVESRQGRG